MRRLTIIAALAAAATLTGCAATTTQPETQSQSAQSQFLSLHKLQGLSAEQIIDKLDAMAIADRPTDMTASVRVDELVLKDSTGEVSLPLPADRFYISLAPFVKQSHECFYHSLTTCRGEMGNQEFQFKVTATDGSVIFEGTRTSFGNGFIGTWLPRGSQGTITVTDSNGLSGQVLFGTGADAATCVTTLQLT
ncbi:MAG: CueP family metal-binding protein [Microbacteriaceae bacterium]|nr:CueP family metal-binding protein [Microbacteriaceae bacterium]